MARPDHAAGARLTLDGVGRGAGQQEPRRDVREHDDVVAEQLAHEAVAAGWFVIASTASACVWSMNFGGEEGVDQGFD